MELDLEPRTTQTAPETKHKMDGRLLLDVVVGESAVVFELFAGEDETLLVGRDAFLVLDFGLDIGDGVGWLDLERDGFACKGFHENLHVGCLWLYCIRDKLISVCRRLFK